MTYRRESSDNIDDRYVLICVISIHTMDGLHLKSVVKMWRRYCFCFGSKEQIYTCPLMDSIRTHKFNFLVLVQFLLSCLPFVISCNQYSACNYIAEQPHKVALLSHAWMFRATTIYIWQSCPHSPICIALLVKLDWDTSSFISKDPWLPGPF